jgi:hypothetical protein
MEAKQNIGGDVSWVGAPGPNTEVWRNERSGGRRPKRSEVTGRRWYGTFELGSCGWAQLSRKLTVRLA